MEIKITSKKEIQHSKEITIFYANEIPVVKLSKYKEYFCSIGKGGNPSTIRDKQKNAKDITWNREGLKQVIGHSNFFVGSPSRRFSTQTQKEADFMDDYPDTTWGYSGSSINAKRIKELILNCIENNALSDE